MLKRRFLRPSPTPLVQLSSMFQGSQGTQETAGDTQASEYYYYYATEIGNAVDFRLALRCVFVLPAVAVLVSIGFHFWNRLRGTSPVQPEEEEGWQLVGERDEKDADEYAERTGGSITFAASSAPGIRRRRTEGGRGQAGARTGRGQGSSTERVYPAPAGPRQIAPRLAESILIDSSGSLSEAQIIMKARFLVESRDELRAELRRRGLSTTGLKSQLAERLACDSDVSLDTCRALAAATGVHAPGGIGLILAEIRDLESNARLNRRLQDLTAPGSASRGHSAQLQRAGG